MASIKFLGRILIAWFAAWCVLMVVWNAADWNGGELPLIFRLAIFVGMLMSLARGVTHLYRVRTIAGRVDAETLSNRQRRRVELACDVDEAFVLVEEVVRELPYVQDVHARKGSLTVQAMIRPPRVEAASRRWRRWLGSVDRDTRVSATVTPADGSSSAMVACEPDVGAWADWFYPDTGVSLDTVETLMRAITQRMAVRRSRERADARQTAMEKELTAAQLGLLQAQVEPHFLYNTLASAQELVRTDPARADRMLGHLIDYLRRSLPRTDGSLSTLGQELERSTAWLEIMRLRMGERLAVHVDVAATALTIPMPSMMLQTLVENAIKHGLEPKPGGGGIWIRAGVDTSLLSLTVADDGLGFRSDGAGTGIGLKNLRERLRLTYAGAAGFTIGNNFPHGVAATITLPVHEGASHA
ncbi:sensor histidine kinase [Luteibacter sahnii]|uniref:sensor histidine kinase n=1 Tax=Luteibacter sahnii TaxID=3021977 RepID=UPI002A6B8F91|nr:histidine kinase [Luteibacter sp. PPL193]MDY1547529.1 histidine kinase [Luteibacter sp. PPL193]